MKKDPRGYFFMRYFWWSVQRGDAKHPMYGGATGIQTLDLCLAKAAL